MKKNCTVPYIFVLRLALAICLAGSCRVGVAFGQDKQGFAEAEPAEKVGDLAKREGKKASPPAQGAALADAVKLYDAGRLEEAQSAFEKIARENPVETDSRRYLKSILSIKRKWAARDQNTVERDRILDVRRSWLPVERSTQEKKKDREQDERNQRRHVMEERLAQIIPEIHFTDAKLRDVVAYLSKISGVNILLDEDLVERGEEAIEEIETGGATRSTSPEAAVPAASGGLSSGVTVDLKDVPLIEALKYILVPKGLQYRVDEYAIVIASSRKLDGGEMETRDYHLSSGIGAFVPIRKGKAGKGRETAPEEDSTLTIKDVLEQSGVPFPEGAKIFLDARTGTLIVRNTSGNLAIIEKIIGALDVTPFQVTIESKFVDISEDTARELGLESFITRDTPLSIARGPNDVIAARAGNANAGQFTSSTVDQKGFTHGLRFLSTAAGAPRGNIFNFASVLTQPQFQLVLHALDQSGMANILSAPKVTTANNQQAKIEVVTEIFYPTQFQITPATTNDQGTVVTPPVVIPGAFTSRSVGIELEVTPSVGADKKTISLTLVPEVSALSGWQDFGIAVGSNFPAIPILQPIFTSKNVTASIVINDTETVVLGGLIKDDTTTQADKIPVLGDMPFLGGAFRSNSEVSTK